LDNPQNSKYGAALAVVTAVMWGTLPFAVGPALGMMDTMTLTSLRFLFAAVCLAPFLNWKRYLAVLHGKNLVLVFAAAICLGCNYFFYMNSIRYLAPTVAQTLIQLAPIFLIAGSVLVFRDRMSSRQFVALAILLIGFAVFLLPGLSSFDQKFFLGLLSIFTAAVTWAVYAMLQRRLHGRVSGMQLMFSIYLVCGVLSLPWSDPTQMLAVDTPLKFAIIGYCCINTLIAYSAFGESLKHLQPTKVGAILAATPQVTFATTLVLTDVLPVAFVTAHPFGGSYIGACLVVFGSALFAVSPTELRPKST
jgi:drug/metabolite transporter (DMT)-like permease